MNRDLEVIKSEALFYNSMTALLCEPEEELGIYPEIFKQLNVVFSQIINNHTEYVQKLSDSLLKTGYERLLIEYSRIFIGPFQAIAHPYSSVYLGEKQLNGFSTVWVENFYRLAGFEFNDSLKDLPDHITVELEFLYTLKFNEIQCFLESKHKKAESWKNKHDEFYNNHFKLWVPKFCNLVIDKSESEYYNLLAECLKAFITQHKLN